MMLLFWNVETWWKRGRFHPRLPFAPCRLVPRRNERARPAQFGCQLPCKVGREISVVNIIERCEPNKSLPLPLPHTRSSSWTEVLGFGCGSARKIELVSQARRIVHGPTEVREQ